MPSNKSPSESDEETLVVPKRWQRRVHPRRGYPSASHPPVKPDKKARDKLLAHYETLRDNLLAGSKKKVADAAVIRAVDARLTKGAAPTDPRVEGAVAALARYRVDYYAKPKPDAAVDHWVQDAGLPFAVDAVLHSFSFSVGVAPRAGWKKDAWIALGDMTDEANAKSYDAPAFFGIANDVRPLLRRLRGLLAACLQEDYEAALELAAKHRKKSGGLGAYPRRVATSYLFSTRRDWVDADLSDFAKESRKNDGRTELRLWRPDQMSVLLTTLTRHEQFRVMNGLDGAEELPESPWELPVSPRDVLGRSAAENHLATMLEGMGAELVPLCCYWHDTGGKAEFAEAIAAIPTDEAMLALIDRADDKRAMAALTRAIERFPGRARRLIGERVEARGAHWNRLRDLVPTERAPKGRSKAKGVSGEVPSALEHPPWERKTSNTPARPIADLPRLDHEPSFGWLEGEKQRFATTNWDPSSVEPGGYLETLQNGNWAPAAHFSEWTEAQWRELTTDWKKRLRIVHGPEPLSLELVEHYCNYGKYFYQMHVAVARYEGRILPLIVKHAALHPKEALSELGPFDAPELAPIVAGVAHIKKLAADAEAWLVRHPRASAVGLIPDAVGKSSKARRAAVTALQLIDRKGHGEIVREVAARYGREALAAVAALLGDDPRLKRQPSAPVFWSPSTLPEIALKTGGALPDGALENLRIMLALNELDHPFPGLEEALSACEPASLSAFGWALFEAWGRAGYPPKEKWALAAQGVLGDDETVRSLAPLVRKWPGDGGHARAADALEVLAAIGTDLALMSIHGIAQRLKFKALQELAERKIASIAEQRNLSLDELADRLVPTLDLDEHGTRELDFGARQFTVGFDEMLTPFVLDGAGKPLRRLPKPGAKDDASKAETAKKAFAALKKDLRTISRTQIFRLEDAMVRRRRWATGDFHRFFVEHPLMRHLVRRMLWATYKKDTPAQTFRVAEDGSLASIDDGAFTLPGGAEVGLVHPLELAARTLKRWGDLFSDYELLQPFSQLGRGCFALKEAATLLEEIRAATHATGAVLQLAKAGWSRGAPQDSGWVGELTRPSALGELRLELEQGFIAGAVGESPEQTLRGVFVEGERRPITPKHLEALHPIELSELAHSLATLAG